MGPESSDTGGWERERDQGGERYLNLEEEEQGMTRQGRRNEEELLEGETLRRQ